MTHTFSKYQAAVFAEAKIGKSNVIVQARAGSGKTTTLLETMSRLRGRFAGVAFNKPIATELDERLKAEHPNVKGWVSTCHSFGFKACRQLGMLDVDKDRTMKIVVGLMGDDWSSYEYRRLLCDGVNRAKCELLSESDDIDQMLDRAEINVPADTPRDKFVEQIIDLLNRSKQVDNVVDFADMVWLPNVLDLKVSTFDTVLGDEVQDWNRSQLELVFKMVSGRLFAFGDDRQAIYRFMGADEKSMQRIEERFGCKTLPLSITYRCPKNVVKLAQKIVPDLEAAPDAEDGVVDFAADERMYREALPGDFIISRVNAPLVSLCLRFLRDGRKANIQGRDIGDQLANFVKRSKSKTVEDLRVYVTVWAQNEITRLDKVHRSYQAVEDKRDCLLALTEAEPTVEGVVTKIQKLFENSDDKNRITLSSTHKAKGLERDRVWILKNTFRQHQGNVEEDNLWYVGVTRAKKELYLTDGFKRRGQDE